MLTNHLHLFLGFICSHLVHTRTDSLLHVCSMLLSAPWAEREGEEASLHCLPMPQVSLLGRFCAKSEKLTVSKLERPLPPLKMRVNSDYRLNAVGLEFPRWKGQVHSHSIIELVFISGWLSLCIQRFTFYTLSQALSQWSLQSFLQIDLLAWTQLSVCSYHNHPNSCY